MAHLLPGSILYPFGPACDDELAPEDDDGSTDRIRLLHPFTFYHETHDNCYVNNNGAISFEKPVPDYTPDAFPLADFCMVCPYWADCDNENEGDIYFGQRTDKETLETISEHLKNYFELSTCEIRSALIVTWYRVGYHGSESNKTNTFQAVLCTDEEKSFAIFNYHDMQWTTGTASEGDALTGLGGYAAQAGFNTGREYFNMPHSRTEHIRNVQSTSNVGVPGRWVFRVDDMMAPGGCMHKDTFLHFGQTIWTDQSCDEKCSCKISRKMECENKPCEDNLVCLPLGRHYMCQINEEDC